MRSHRCRTILTCIVVGLLPAGVRAQGGGGLSGSDSRVGYIDNAIPATEFRLRFDNSSNDHRPTRAEFLYPKGKPNGPGLPEPQRSVDFQELASYLEFAPSDRLSAFVEFPARWVQFANNPSHSGFSDMNTGFKFAFLREADEVGTFQFRVYAPTGAASRGLGNRHVSLEPAFLFYQRLTERFTGEAELRAWVPVGGTDFAGDIIRYGVGVSYDLYNVCNIQFAPVAEFVGWTVLSGKTNVVLPSGDSFSEDAAGQTIVNAKLGLRVKFSDHAEFYTGYGRPLTGNRWYENTFRLEFRLFF